MTQGKVGRRSLTFALLGTSMLARTAAGQTPPYPSKPITWVVITPPGGILDTTSRVIAAKLRQELGQTIVVENKPGAGGVIAAEFVARSAPDGYTILMGTQSTNAANVATFKNLPYDPLKDFIPVHALYEVSSILIANRSLPYKTTTQLVEYARAHPGKVNFATPSPGSASHLTAELFMSAAKIQMTHVPYKGGAQALQDLMAGAVDVTFDYPVTSVPLVEAGKVNALAVLGATRLTSLPNVPTIAEEGFPAAETVAWAGAFVPSRTPEHIVKRLADALTAALKEPEVASAITKVGQTPLPNLRGEEFRKFNTEEVERWKAVVGQLSVKLE